MQDGIRLALLHFLQQLTDFQCGRRNDLNTALFRFRQDFVHYRKRAMGAGPDNEPLASPGNFFPGRKRRVAKLFAELLGRSLLPFPHFAAVDHHIMRVALSLDLDLAKFDQSCFRISNVPLAGAPTQETGILRACSLLTASPSVRQEIDSCANFF